MAYDAGYDSTTSEDPPHVSSERAPPRAPQEQPSIATIEDEQEPATFSGASGSPQSASSSTLPTEPPKAQSKTRAKTRANGDQHPVILPCIIDVCIHVSLTPKEREKHMDTHFPKRWQCGSCKKFYATSYTLKRHSDSIKIPEGCKGAYEANNFTKSPPYWKMPEYADRVRMPGPKDYLLSDMLDVFNERDKLLAKDGLKRPLPTETKAATDAPAPKRARKSLPRRKTSDAVQPVPAKTEVSLTGFAALVDERPLPLERAAAADVPAFTRASSEAGPSRSPETVSSAGSAGVRSPSPETPVTPDVLMADAEAPSELRETTASESDRESARTLVHSRTPAEIEGRTAQYVSHRACLPTLNLPEQFSRHICLQLWAIDHPAANREEFDKHWAGLGQEERQAYEVLAKLRVCATSLLIVDR